MNLQKIATGTAASAILAAGVFGFSHTVTQAAPIEAQWMWSLPNGTILGSCAGGYHPQWSRITDLNTTATFLVSTQAGNVPWSVVQAAIDSGAITNWTQFVYNFTSPEETEPDGYTPQLGQLYEGDCVMDGTALPTGPYAGNGDSTPTASASDSSSASATATDTPSESATATPTVSATPTATATSTATQTATPIPGITASNKPTATATATKRPTPKANVAPAVHTYTATVQVDRYRPRTAACKAAVQKALTAGKLAFRADRACWGQSNYRIVTVTVRKATAPTAADWTAAVNKAVSAQVFGHLTTAKVTVTGPTTVAWLIPAGAWKDANGGSPQTYLASSH